MIIERTARYGAWAILLGTFAAAGCSKNSCDAPKVEPAQAIYVVSAQGDDGYCGDVRYTGSHANAVQACIDRASDAGGGIVMVRAGTYTTGNWARTLKGNVRLEAEDAPAASEP